MANNALHKVVEQAKANRRRNRWNKVVTGMAAFVVFCTTYALILPAITEEREPLCGLEEHIHEDKCWEMPKVITCPYEVKAENGELPLLVHTHDELCYDTLGNLICALPEVESHVHDYGCYTEIVPEAPHTHSDACYTEEKVLTCTLEESEGHIHDESCDGEITALICEVPESEGHAHGEGCYDESGALICMLPESEGHIHGESCYGTAPGRICGLEESEGHIHGDACYALQRVLTCEKPEATPEEIAAYTGEPEKVLTCGKEEIILHQHTEECRDEDGNLICGLKELYAHQHGKECLTTTRDPEAEKVLVCGFKEEHTHDDTCYTDLEADLETPEMWEIGLPELNDHWAEDLIAVAQTQLGYAESTENVTVSPEGLISGYTRYGQWAGTPYGPWSLTFVDFCQHYAGIPADAYPVHEGQLRWCEQLKEENWNLYWSPDQYTPVPGDMVFMDLDVDGKMDAEAIVLELTEATEEAEAKLTVIQGDVEGSVQKVEYDPADPVILGYASTAAARSRWDFLNPAPQPEPVRYCGLEAHTHVPECYDAEENLICEIPEHTHEDACLVPPVVYYCGMETHKHDENCYDNQGTMTCTLQEHTHDALCQVEQKYFCGMEEHIHEDACYDENNVLICGKEAHTHGETCELAEQTLEAQIESPATLELDEEEAKEQTVVRVSGLIPNGAVVKAVPVDLSDLYEGFVCAYDISIFTAQGREFQPVIPLKVTFDIPGQTLTEEDDVSICYVPKLDEPDGDKIYSDELQKMSSQINEDGNLTFDAPHFTTYLEIEGYDAGDGTGDGTTPPELSPPIRCNKNPCPLDEKLSKWEAGTGTNPFGSAQEFNLFLLGNMKSWGEVHGNAAIGGNISGTNQGITYDAGSTFNYSAHTMPVYDVGLILGGTAESAKNIVEVRNGSIVAQSGAHPKLGMDWEQPADHRHAATEDQLTTYFGMAEKALVDRNKATWDYCESLENGDAHLGEVRYLTDADINNGVGIGVAGDAGVDVYLTGTDPFYNVFNLPEEFYNASGDGTKPREVYLDVPYGSYTILNIEAPEGSNPPSLGVKLHYKNSKGHYIDQPADKGSDPSYSQYQRTLMNFDPSISKVTAPVAGLYVYASMLGPKVELEVPASSHVHLQGTIVLHDLTCLGDPNNSSILFNPFLAGSQVYMFKDMVCDTTSDEANTSCPVTKENAVEGGMIDPTIDEYVPNKWPGYYVDLTLQSVQSDGTTPMTKVLEHLAVSGKGYVLNGLTPGTYKISDELLYREHTFTYNGASYDKYFIENDTGKMYVLQGEQRVYVSGIYGEDNGLDPIMQDHVFNFATFGSTEYDGLTGMKVNYKDEKWPTFTVESGDYRSLLVTDHYGKTPSMEFSVSKRWMLQETDSLGNVTEYYITAPEGAEVEVGLEWSIKGTEAWSPYKVDGEQLVATLNAENNWFYNWTNLPKKQNGVFDVEYRAREIGPWPGFDVDYTQTEFDKESGIYYITNKKEDDGSTALAVVKKWLDISGEPGQPPKDFKDLNVHLYQQVGRLPSDAERSPEDSRTVSLYLNEKSPENLLGSVDVWAGSNLKLCAHVAVPTTQTPAAQTQFGFAVDDNGLNLELLMLNEQYEQYDASAGSRHQFWFNLTSVYTNKDLILTLNPTDEVERDIFLPPQTNPILQPSLEITDQEVPSQYIRWETKVVDETTGREAPKLTQVDPNNAGNPGIVPLNAGNSWTHTWKNLPSGSVKECYRYFVFEDVPPTYEATYILGKNLEFKGVTAEDAGSMPGVNEGIIRIENRPNPGGPELPMTGGPGTVLYTLGGLFTALLAGFLMQYNHRKRGKEGNAF